MKLVKSSNIKYIHYEPHTQTLEVTFHHNDSVYHYHGVSENDYKLFENAKSHGDHFKKFIKDKFLSKKKHDGKKKKV